MAERAGQLAEILQKLFPNQDLRLRVESFVDSISQIKGMSRLVLAKFNNGEFRFYALWAKEQDKDYLRIKESWDDAFLKSGADGERVPLVIQYSERAFGQLEESSHQLKQTDKFVLCE